MMFNEKNNIKEQLNMTMSPTRKIYNKKDKEYKSASKSPIRKNIVEVTVSENELQPLVAVDMNKDLKSHSSP